MPRLSALKQDVLNAWAAQLPEHDWLRLGSMTSNKRTRAFICGRYLAAFATEQTGKRECPSTLSNGRPILSDGRFISVSHSGDWVVVGLSGSPCGLDVESIRIRPFAKICAEYFHSKEVGRFERLDVQQQANYFFDLWTAKEALSKYLDLDLWGLLNRNVEAELKKNDLITHFVDLDATTKLCVVTKSQDTVTLRLINHPPERHVLSLGENVVVKSAIKKKRSSVLNHD